MSITRACGLGTLARGPCLLTEKERLCVAMRAHKSPEAQDKGFPRDGRRSKEG